MTFSSYPGRSGEGGVLIYFVVSGVQGYGCYLLFVA